MGARGGPLDVAGYESALISVADFYSSSKEQIKALEMEVEDCMEVDDEEIRVDDLKFLSPESLINIAIEHTTTPGSCLTNQDNGAKAKRKRSKNGLGASRATLQTDPEVESMILSLIEERNTAKTNASASLHSLRLMNEATKRLRSAGALRFGTSAIEEGTALAPANDGNEDIAPESEVLITIDYYNSANLKVQELLVLGSQSLAEFRDQLPCVTDELANEKNVGSPSGYFFIENVFYNDLRHPDSVDYSENLISWIQKEDESRARKRGRLTKLPSFTKASMPDTCFSDLAFKLGSKYLYCHQGDCKHVFMFRDVRLIHEDDPRSRSCYPFLRFLPRLRYKKCSICSVYRAKKLVRDDKLAPSNPCFFCDTCYYSLHYSREGVLLYEDFTVEDCVHE